MVRTTHWDRGDTIKLQAMDDVAEVSPTQPLPILQEPPSAPDAVIEQRSSHVVVTIVGPEGRGINLAREIAGFVKRHGGNIVANDLIRHGSITTMQFIVAGSREARERIAQLIGVFSSEFGVIGVAHFCSGLADTIEVRSQGHFRFSLHGRDYKGLLWDVLSAIQESGFTVVQCHGRLQSLWADEIPADMRDHPDARVEYRLSVALQPTQYANEKALRARFGRLFDEQGVFWSRT